MKTNKFDTQFSEKKYVSVVSCNNCLYFDNVSIDRGVPVVKAECPNCGCKELQPRQRLYVPNFKNTIKEVKYD